jgi:hypothetical protein
MTPAAVASGFEASGQFQLIMPADSDTMIASSAMARSISMPS